MQVLKDFREKEGKAIRQPTLSTIRMIEEVLKKNKDKPLKIANLKRLLPKQVMHQTLLTTLDYLQESGKIFIGTKGVQWIKVSPEHFQKMMEDTLEV